MPAAGLPDDPRGVAARRGVVVGGQHRLAVRAAEGQDRIGQRQQAGLEDVAGPATAWNLNHSTAPAVASVPLAVLPRVTGTAVAALLPGRLTAVTASVAATGLLQVPLLSFARAKNS